MLVQAKVQAAVLYTGNLRFICRLVSFIYLCPLDQGKIFGSYCVNQNLYFVLGAYSTIQDTHGFAWAPKDKRKYGIRNVQLFVGISDLIVLIRKRASTKVIR